MRIDPWRVRAAALAAVLCPSMAAAQAVGNDFRVNEFTSGAQDRSTVAMANDGTFLVFWDTVLQDGDLLGITGRRHDALGSPLGVEFVTNTHTTGTQSSPSAAVLAGGGYIVAWAGDRVGDAAGISARLFDASGQPVGSDFAVNVTTAQTQKTPSVAGEPSGGFVVVWASNLQDGSSYAVAGRRFDANGNPLGSEFAVNTFTTGYQADPDVAVAGNGRFLVAWTSANGFDVFARRYDSGGTALGSDFRVNTYTTYTQNQPAVAADASGNFVVAWKSFQDGGGYNVFAQRYDNNGAALGGEFRVNLATAGHQYLPDVAMDRAGNFVVAWVNSGLARVEARRFRADGTPIGADFQVNTTAGFPFYPAVGLLADATFVVAWTKQSDDIYLRRYDEIFGDGFE